jgi:hypothetical protein
MTEGLEAEPRPSLPAGARCAHHPDRAAERTCVRCGNYMCAQCVSLVAGEPQSLCLTCASRAGVSARFPYSRDSYSLDGLLNLALSRWKENWLPLALCTLGLFIVPISIALIAKALDLQNPLAAIDRHTLAPDVLAALLMAAAQQIVSTVLQTGLYLMMFGYVLDILEGNPTGVAKSIARLRGLPAQVLSMLIVYGGGFVVLGLIAGVVLLTHAYELLSLQVWIALTVFFGGGLFTWLFASFAFVMFELAHDPNAGMVGAMQASLRLVDGQRMRVLGMSSLAMLISLAGVLLCCVGVFASVPLSTLLYGAMFLALKQTTRPALAVRPHWPV